MLLGAFPLAAFAAEPHDDVFVKLENLITAIDQLEPAPVTAVQSFSEGSEVGDTIQVSFNNVMESWDYGGYYGDRWPNITAQGAAVAVCAVLDGNDPLNGTYSGRTDAPDNILRLLVAYDKGSYTRRDLQFAIWGISGAGNAGALKGSMTHNAAMGADPSGNITRINNTFDKIPERLRAVETQLAIVHQQIGSAKAELEKPFSQEAELTEKSSRLAALDALLNMDDKPEAEKSNNTARKDDAR